jgi:hypothetical protein
VPTTPTGIPLPPGPIGPILSTDFVNPSIGTEGNWTSRIAHGHTYLTGGHAWINALDPGNQFDQPMIGLSGTVVSEPEISNADLPFLHPFGFDYEFLVAPDAQYDELVGPNMTESYKTATEAARAQGLDVSGVVGMEIEKGLVPKPYRASRGDRVCLFGRLIVDAGHDDFHTEIHPPLVMVCARPARSGQQLSSRARGLDATTASIIARPFLVDQDFDDGAVVKHLAKEFAKVNAPIPSSFQMEAKPRLMPTPFLGVNVMTFKLRPPTPRVDSADRLIVTSSLTRRDDSVAVQLLPGSDRDSIRIIIVLNEAGYVPPPEPRRISSTWGFKKLFDMDPIDGVALLAAVVSPTFNPIGPALIGLGGVETHEYAALAAPKLPSPRVSTFDELRPVHVLVDATQPFPLAGMITVEWERASPPAPGGVVTHATNAPPNAAARSGRKK